MSVVYGKVMFIMQIKKFLDIIGVEFYTGIPDSKLKPLCNYLIHEYGISDHHIICANEGNCTAVAAGYYMATGKIPMVYMQNSGIGNIINPVASLLSDKVYGIPCIFVVGWRGEPGLHDEPQHVFQGEVTITLLEDMDISTYVVTEQTTEDELVLKMSEFQKKLKKGKSVAFVIKENAITYSDKVSFKNENNMKREDIIKHIVKYSEEDIIVSTTGKASRELFEIREANEQSHKYDFLTVGSMGHTSSIALGIAMIKKDSRVWCIDGDGAVLMHMGAMAVIGAKKPDNMVHIVLNNGAHETVGGMPTVAGQIDLQQIAKGCGYSDVFKVSGFEELDNVLENLIDSHRLSFVEIQTAIGSRSNLGRPTTTAMENKINFMKYLEGK